MLSKSNGNVIKRIKIGKKKVSIIFEDESKLDISLNTYTDFNLYPKKVIDDKLLKEIKKRDSFDEAYNYALGIVSKKEISETALIKKLEAKKISKSNIKEIISLLKKHKLIDEKSLIEEYMVYASYHLYGKNRIIDELYKKGVNKEYINEIVFKEKDELDKAIKLVGKIESKYDKLSYEEKKNHIYEALLRYGYDYDIASKALDSIKSFNKKSEINNLKIEYEKSIRKYKGSGDSKEVEDKVIKYLLRKGYHYEDIKIIKEK